MPEFRFSVFAEANEYARSLAKLKRSPVLRPDGDAWLVTAPDVQIPPSAEAMHAAANPGKNTQESGSVDAEQGWATYDRELSRPNSESSKPPTPTDAIRRELNIESMEINDFIQLVRDGLRGFDRTQLSRLHNRLIEIGGDAAVMVNIKQALDRFTPQGEWRIDGDGFGGDRAWHTKQRGFTR